MSVKYLYYTESEAFGGNLSTAHSIPWIDQLTLMYGGSFACIHPDRADYEASARETYPTLLAAQAAYPSHTWIYLDQSAPTYIDELVHPADDVVYVVGHDLDGYRGEALNGNSYKMRVLPPDFEGHAVVCLSLVAMDRWTRRQSWR